MIVFFNQCKWSCLPVPLWTDQFTHKKTWSTIKEHEMHASSNSCHAKRLKGFQTGFAVQSAKHKILATQDEYKMVKMNILFKLSKLSVAHGLKELTPVFKQMSSTKHPLSSQTHTVNFQSNRLMLYRWHWAFIIFYTVQVDHNSGTKCTLKSGCQDWPLSRY